jgi:hypothetical protein
MWKETAENKVWMKRPETVAPCLTSCAARPDRDGMHVCWMYQPRDYVVADCNVQRFDYHLSQTRKKPQDCTKTMSRYSPIHPSEVVLHFCFRPV